MTAVALEGNLRQSYVVPGSMIWEGRGIYGREHPNAGNWSAGMGRCLLYKNDDEIE
jgi:hypothetical protein